jgi:hypothetical protein
MQSGIPAMLAATKSLIEGSETQTIARGNLADRPKRGRIQTRRAPAAGSVCLVVSPDPLRQLMFGQAAVRTGWRQVVCADQASALPHLASGTVGLVLVDTATPNPNTAADRRLLVELLSDQQDLLTVVCGRTNDSQEEIWARQNKAWMYLPGVAPESDLDPVLLSAKEVQQRMKKRASASRLASSGIDY